MFVLGIDPGLSRCGYGLVEKRGSELVGIDHGVFRTPPTDDLPYRLSAMNAMMRDFMAVHRPTVVVVERVFFQTNARTAMGVAQASGLALAAAVDVGAAVIQYTSNEVKLSITGFGGATKDQVQRMVARMLSLSEIPKPADAADALALALHHIGQAPFGRVASSIGGVGPLGLRIAQSVGGGEGGSPLGNARIARSIGGKRAAQ
jgi:crossover junction endodeoxyribonuclease RuvC